MEQVLIADGITPLPVFVHVPYSTVIQQGPPPPSASYQMLCVVGSLWSSGRMTLAVRTWNWVRNPPAPFPTGPTEHSIPVATMQASLPEPKPLGAH